MSGLGGDVAIDYDGVLPTDPDDVLAFLDAMERGEDPSTVLGKDPKQADDPADEADSVAADAGDVDKPEVDAQKEPKKHQVPYEVMKHERTLRQQAEAEARALKEQLAAVESAKTDNTATVLSDLSADELEIFQEDFPVQYAALVKQQQAIDSLKKEGKL